MNTKPLLVAYATRFGSTQEVAEAIAAVLRQAELNIELQPMQEVKSLDPYAAVVLGAAIYNTHWHADAHQFLSQHQQTLRRLPVAIFALGPLATGEAPMRNSLRQLDKELAKYPWLKPVALQMFAGKYDPAKPGLSFFERLLSARDHRDWTAIRLWANALPKKLQLDEVSSAA